MEWIQPVLQAVQVLSSLTIIGLVLLQQGKGADMGSAFGSGSAGSVFGAAGAANFLSRTTKYAAIVFFVSTAGLAWVVYKPSAKAEIESGVMQGFESIIPGMSAPAPATPAAPDVSVPVIPATPAPAASVPQAVEPTVEEKVEPTVVVPAEDAKEPTAE
ncbi:preprotein translocase subunit SecG [Paenalcaligenes suwonensis]|uniref:preprotein translocase subunit SecG n=1 Tax=Paenalcaligenes suwonensis TaxID=1202713 RepID=UPI00140C3589|nr:preprotein translocase subunit SecG [Paenalcaligenes suwonensis]NHC62750.1 preprotein translocase subunit SecG [Paenalcaligenes suwonensis]